MRTPVFIKTITLLGLYIFVSSYDLPVYIAPIVPDYSRSPRICFIHNKPIFCPTDLTNSQYNLLYSDTDVGRETHTYKPHASPYMYPKSTIYFNGPPGHIHKRPTTLFNSRQAYLESSFLYSPNTVYRGSFLYNTPPLTHGKHNYEVTTVKPSTLPSDDSVDGNMLTSKTVISSPLKHDRGNIKQNVSIFDKFIRSLERFERKFYQITFNKLLSISPPDRVENGISFAQSNLFLYLALLALSTELDTVSAAEIETSLQLKLSDFEKTKLLQMIMSWLPISSLNLKFRWTTRMVLEPGLTINQNFLEGPAAALKMKVDWLNGTETSGNLTKIINNMIKIDSGGAMRNTFEEDEFSEGACSILLNTIYVRARWRSPPTALNGTRPFHGSEHGRPQRSVPMIRINDIMRYAAVEEWSADALEIRYATPGLAILLLVPRGHSLRSFKRNITIISLRKLDKKLRPMRVAATLPIYTLRMTLLLPGKLQAMGISHLVETNYTKGSGCGKLRLSHAVQRIMFWAEAGPNAYKDDGIEWDEAPEKEFIVDRPYLFYVRWNNVTLINGNFVL